MAMPSVSQVSPGHWLEHWVAHGEHLRSQTSCEYRGDQGPVTGPRNLVHRRHLSISTVLNTRAPAANRYGLDQHPAGPSACARRGCAGCCYCRSAASLPVYLEVWILPPPVLLPGMICSRKFLCPWLRTWARKWVTVDELGAYIGELASSRAHDAVPVYLLLRRPELPTCGHSGQVLCVAGDVRNHVAASELSEWAVRLERCKMLLHIVSSDTRELVFDYAERARIDTYLSEQAAVHEQMNAEWESLRAQAAEWSSSIQAERRQWGRVFKAWLH